MSQLASSRLDGAADHQNDVSDDRHPKRVRADVGNLHKRRHDSEHDQRHGKPEMSNQTALSWVPFVLPHNDRVLSRFL